MGAAYSKLACRTEGIMAAFMAALMADRRGRSVQVIAMEKVVEWERGSESGSQQAL